MTHTTEDDINVGDFVYIGIGDIRVGPCRVDEIYVRFNGEKLYATYDKPCACIIVGTSPYYEGEEPSIYVAISEHDGGLNRWFIDDSDINRKLEQQEVTVAKLNGLYPNIEYQEE